jgi:glutathione S-transferase
MTIQIVASYAGKSLDFIPFDSAIHQTPDFKAISPLRKLPVVEFGDVVATSVSSAVRFLARDTELLPQDPERKSDVDTWIGLCLTDLEPAV